jgi:hypothetical protein
MKDDALSSFILPSAFILPSGMPVDRKYFLKRPCCVEPVAGQTPANNPSPFSAFRET